jgi:hypothetical protein
MAHSVRAHKPKAAKRGRAHRFSGEVHPNGSVTTTIHHARAEDDDPMADKGMYRPSPEPVTAAHPHIKAAMKHIKQNFMPAGEPMGEPDGDEGGM